MDCQIKKIYSRTVINNKVAICLPLGFYPECLQVLGAWCW